jgi:hypothetical protein
VTKDVSFDVPLGKLAEFMSAKPGEVPPFISEIIDDHAQVGRSSSSNSEGEGNTNSNNNALAVNGAQGENGSTGSRCDSVATGKQLSLFICSYRRIMVAASCVCPRMVTLNGLKEMAPEWVFLQQFTEGSLGEVSYRNVSKLFAY